MGKKPISLGFIRITISGENMIPIITNELRVKESPAG